MSIRVARRLWIRNYIVDEGRPLGVGLQESASNRFQLLWPKVMVVSVGEKAWHKIKSGV